MKLSTVTKALSCFFIVVLFQTGALAHTGLKVSVPADGMKIKAEPSEITLTFTADVKLIKLELMGVGHEMPTSFKPNSEAMTSFVFETPGMHAGKFTVNWAAIGADGHTLTDSFSFEVDPTISADVAAP